MYLMATMDWLSRFVIAWQLSNTLIAQLTLRTFWRTLMIFGGVYDNT